MRLVVEIHVQGAPSTPNDSAILQILEIVQNLQTKGTDMALDITALQDQVTHNTDVTNSAVALIQGLAAAFADAQGNPAALASLTTQLQDSAQRLADAVVANTPVAPPPVPPVQ